MMGPLAVAKPLGPAGVPVGAAHNLTLASENATSLVPIKLPFTRHRLVEPFRQAIGSELLIHFERQITK